MLQTKIKPTCKHKNVRNLLYTLKGLLNTATLIHLKTVAVTADRKKDNLGSTGKIYNTSSTSRPAVIHSRVIFIIILTTKESLVVVS